MKLKWIGCICDFILLLKFWYTLSKWIIWGTSCLQIWELCSLEEGRWSKLGRFWSTTSPSSMGFHSLFLSKANTMNCSTMWSKLGRIWSTTSPNSVCFKALLLSKANTTNGTLEWLRPLMNCSNVCIQIYTPLLLHVFCLSKGQLISKEHFGVFKSTKKNNEICVRISALASKKRSK